MRGPRRFSRREYLCTVASALAAPVLLPAGGRAQGRLWRVTGPDVPELASFDRTIETYMRLRNVRSGALAVSNNGRLVLARGYSWDSAPDMAVQPTSLFRIASISKPLTAAAVMQLVDRGRLSLSAPVSSIIDLGRQRDPRVAQITILQLLQHLGGWDRTRSFDPMFYDSTIRSALRIGLPIRLNDIITYMADRQLDWAPAAGYYYSNYGYALLGRVIERIAGSGYEAWVKSAILSPLGITRMRLGRSLLQDRADGEVRYESTFTATTVLDGSGARVPAPYGGFHFENMDSHGQWLASAVDLVRFACTFDQPERSPILSASSIERSWAAPSVGTQNGFHYGCGWYVRPVSGGRRNTWHSGSLAGSWTLLVRRYDGLNWAALFNQRDDPSDTQSTTYSDIDGELHTAAAGVSRWPTHDLFSEYLS